MGLKIHAAGLECAGALALALGHRATSIDHLEHMTDDMAPLLKSTGAVATLLPGVALKNWRAVAPARLLIAEGAAVALASDFNPHHTPTLSMQAVVGLACAEMGMTPAEAIVAATINGAHALGRAARTGSLEPGKDADVLLLNIDDYREMPRCFGVNLVYSTIKRGQRIYQEGAIRHAG